MVESLNHFPFRKLAQEKYLTLEVMMFVDYLNVCEFMYSVNHETRNFLQSNFITIRNGFINEGLITYELYDCFNDMEELENLYF